MSDLGGESTRSAPPPVQESAQLLGVHSATLYRALKQGWDGFPESFARFSRARRATAAKPGPKSRPANPEDPASRSLREEVTRWDLRYRRAKTAREEMQLEALRRNLVPRGEVLHLLVSRVAEMRSTLLLLPQSVLEEEELEPGLAARLEQRLEAAVRRALEHFARGAPLLEEEAAADDSDGDDEPDELADPGAR